MLEYAYLILQKLSFDMELFRKELKKCITYLTKDEVTQLENWVKVNYHNEFSNSLYSCF